MRPLADPPKEKAITAALEVAGTANPSPAPETKPALKAGSQRRNPEHAPVAAWNPTW